MCFLDLNFLAFGTISREIYFIYKQIVAVSFRRFIQHLPETCHIPHALNFGHIAQGCTEGEGGARWYWGVQRFLRASKPNLLFYIAL
jgi:hypothetical protein